MLDLPELATWNIYTFSIYIPETTRQLQRSIEAFCADPSLLPPIGSWGVSKVTVFSSLFAFRSQFNENIDRWDVSQVTNMTDTFYECRAFNQSLSSRDVSRVTKMNRTFSGCRVFHQSLDSWNVSKVTSTPFMFSSCPAFIQRLSSWVGCNKRQNYGWNVLGMLCLQ